MEEFRDNLLLRYGIRPKGLIQQCDACGENFTPEHALSCKFRGLITWRHNDGRDEFAHLWSLALPASSVNTEPLIFHGVGVRAGQRATGAGGQVADGNGGQGTPAATEDGGVQAVVANREAQARASTAGDGVRGNVIARGFWTRRRFCVFNIRVTDTDESSYGNRSSAKVIQQAEKAKCDKYKSAWQDRQRDFVPLVYSVDGLPGKRAKAAERRLAALLTAKWERQYSVVVNFVRVWMSLAVVRSNTLLMRTERVRSPWKLRAPGLGVECMSGRDVYV